LIATLFNPALDPELHVENTSALCYVMSGFGEQQVEYLTSTGNELRHIIAFWDPMYKLYYDLSYDYREIDLRYGLKTC